MQSTHNASPFRLRLVALFFLLVGTAGCDVFSPGPPLYAGVVVDAESGAPIAGIHVSLKINGGSVGGATTVAFTKSDEAGRFRLRDSEDRASRPNLYVNDPSCFGAGDCPLNPEYGGGLVSRGSQDREDLRIELHRL